MTDAVWRVMCDSQRVYGSGWMVIKRVLFNQPGCVMTRSCAFFLVVSVCFAQSAAADPVLSCEEIDQLGEALMGLGIALEDEDAAIGEDSPEDGALGDVVVGLADVAEAEGDEDLAAAAVGMADAWDAMDRDAYSNALASAVAKLAVISATECEEQ